MSEHRGVGGVYSTCTDAAPWSPPLLRQSPGTRSGFSVTPLVACHVGAAHTGVSLCTLESSGHIDMHLHSTEQSFYVLAGEPLLTTDGRTYRLSADECGLRAGGRPARLA